MVEVDVFWSYGIGASFALGAFRQLRKLQAERDPDETRFGVKDILSLRRVVQEIEKGDSPAFDNQYFLKTVLFLAVLFVPSGANLLWSNANWETMQVGSFETIPGWLVSAFSITNVTQGILGFWATYNCLMKGKYFNAAMQTFASYLGFWFILVNGWDKTGYQRFFSRNREAFDNWKWTNFFGWLTSDVVRILLAYGAFFIPLMLYWISTWLVEGYEMDEQLNFKMPEDTTEQLMEYAKIDAYLLGVVFGGGLGGAVTAHLLIRWFGWVKGLAVFATLFGAGTKIATPWLLKKILKVDSISGTPVWELPAVEESKQKELEGASA